MRIPLLAFLFQGIPECTAMVTLAFVIAKIPLNRNKIILAGIVLASCAYVIRLLPLPFGIHIVLNLLILFIFLIKQGQSELSLALISSLSSYLVLIILETICLSLLMSVFGVTPESFSKNTEMGILAGEPQVIVLFGLAFILNKINEKRGQNNVFSINE